MKLAAAATGRDNNLNLIRVIAATGVLVSHAYPITGGPGTPEPAEALTGFTLGSLCVMVFFALSGFLITQSFDRSKSTEDWLGARIARLFPGLIVVTIATVVILGPLATTLPVGDYFAQIETYTYVPRNVTLAKLQFGLPGVFVSNPYPMAINGSLWTLFYEVLCYGGVLIAFVTGLIGRRAIVLGLAGVACVLYVLSGSEELVGKLPDRLASFRFLSLPFLIGSVFYLVRENLPLRWSMALLLGAMAFIARGTILYDFAFTLALSYATFCAGFAAGRRLLFYNRFGDYSYGIYVYAFPIQQSIVAAGLAQSALMNIALAFPATLACAYVSWHWVEKPALERRDIVADVLRRFRQSLARRTALSAR